MVGNFGVKTILLILLALGVALMNGCSDIKLEGVIATPKTVSIRVKNYCPQVKLISLPGDPKLEPATYIFKDVFAVNSSSSVTPHGFAPSLAKDGIGDLKKANLENIKNFNISYRKLDTNKDGYSDLLMMYLGIVAASQPTLPGCDRTQSSFPDQDNDGLNDCEETLLGTDKAFPDTDLDGIPDYLEVRFGLNPLDRSDAILIPDGDTYSNYQKVKLNLPIGQFVDDTIAATGLIYNVSKRTSISPSSGNQTPLVSPLCYDLKISNIPIMTWTPSPSIPTSLTVNEVWIYITEDSPGQPLQMRNVKVRIAEDIQDKSEFLVDGQTQLGLLIGDGTSIPLKKDDGS